MNFHLRNKRGQKRTGKLLAAFIVFAFLVLGTNYVTGGSVSNMMRTPAAALWGSTGIFEERTTAIKNFFIQKETLRNERDLLKERVQELELYALNNLVLSAENAELKKLLGSDDDAPPYRGILGQVLSHGGAYPFGTLLVSRTTQAQIPIGALVFAEQNVVVGTVAEVGTNNVNVKLVSAIGEETSVLIGSGENIASVTIRGIGNGNMLAEVPRDVVIQVNDPVVLLGEETALVGFVGDIEMAATDAFQIVRMRTPRNLDTLRFVRIR